MRQILIALDQLANAILAGHADETLSARAYRSRASRSLGCRCARSLRQP